MSLVQCGVFIDVSVNPASEEAGNLSVLGTNLQREIVSQRTQPPKRPATLLNDDYGINAIKSQ